MSKARWTKRRKRLAAALVVGLAGLVWGLMLWQLNLGQGLRRASYDLPFVLDDLRVLSGPHPPPEDIVLVYLDEASLRELDQPLAQALDRRLHARLVERLTERGARMIVFDILFHDEKPEQDLAFAAAIQNHGNVVLAGELVHNRTENADTESLLLPASALRRAAAGWALTDAPVDPDGVVRQVRYTIPTDFGDKPALAGFVYQRLRGNAPVKSGEAEFLNYYGPAGAFRNQNEGGEENATVKPGYSFSGVLSDRWFPEDAFRDKIVIIGPQQKAGMSDAGKDVFPTPYSLRNQELTSGMEIQATAIGNLLDGRRITSLPAGMRAYPIILSAILLAAAACLLPPTKGVPLCLLLGAGIGLLGILLQQGIGYHFLWTIPAFGQMPLIAGLSLGAHYLIEYSARWKLRRAFKSYMSDEQARQLDEDELSLELGGKEVELTVLFSDLAGFTSMSEGLPPQALSKALISYFESATEGILDDRGTIIKYIGDAVIATWGAPLKVDREADRAIDAAIQMQVASVKPVTLETADGTIEQVLETRVGINHGLALAGNLGSSRRFDYTVVGDSVNTAARLEGLNKMLGTSILVADSVLAKCTDPERYVTRRMGSFVLKGKTRGIVVFEIIGRRDESPVRTRSADYLRLYQEGLDAFQAGQLSLAAACFSESLSRHDRLPEDPASRLHLDAIAAAGADLSDWRGEVALDSK